MTCNELFRLKMKHMRARSITGKIAARRAMRAHVLECPVCSQHAAALPARKRGKP